MNHRGNRIMTVCAGTLACAMLMGLAMPAQADDWDSPLAGNRRGVGAPAGHRRFRCQGSGD